MTETPKAIVRDAKSASLLRATKFWWVTLVCVALAVGIVFSAREGHGPEIAISFRDGHGIKRGDSVRHLGIDVGTVTAVALTGALDGVRVHVELHPEAAGLARDGTRFWIERPRVGLSGVSGLDTIVGAKYIGVQPAPGVAGAAPKPAREFVGIEMPPRLHEPSSSLEIAIRFDRGHGLRAGDALKHRGIDVGEVTSVTLDEKLAAVEVTVRLAESARGLAHAGSLFWIERPQVNLTGVRGLDTIVAGRHIAVLPGPPDARTLDSFQGLAAAPAVIDRAEGGLEIVLASDERSGLEVGSPLAYRGIHVGRITSVGLSSDATEVEARAWIRPEYRHLVCENTHFWSISGIEVDLGFTGVRMDVESFQTLTSGGVALAIADPPGTPATTGQRFDLEPEAPSGWRDWQPRIAVGNTLLPDGLSLPRPLRVALRWHERNYVGLVRERQRDGWSLRLEGGRLLGLAEALSPIEGARDGKTTLAVAGKDFALEPGTTRAYGRLSTCAVDLGVGDDRDTPVPWPRARLRAPKEPEDCVIVGDPRSPGVPVAVGWLRVEEPTSEPTEPGAADSAADPAWLVEGSLALEPSWHGAVVVSRADGAVIGLLDMASGRNVIVPLVAGVLAAE